MSSSSKPFPRIAIAVLAIVSLAGMVDAYLAVKSRPTPVRPGPAMPASENVPPKTAMPSVPGFDDPSLGARVQPRKLAAPDKPTFNLAVLRDVELAFPWASVGKTEKFGDGIRMTSDSGKGIFVRPLGKEVDWDEQFPGIDPEVRRSIEPLKGYDFYETVLAVTPADLARSATDPKASARLRVLLLLKDGMAANAESGIFSFATPTFRGFQFGKPEFVSHVDVYGFPNNGKGIHLTFFCLKDAGEKITQEEVDRVLSTLRPATNVPGKTTASP